MNGWMDSIPEFEHEIEVLRFLVLQFHQTHYSGAEDFFVAVLGDGCAMEREGERRQA
jgi:hypothetical protein